MTDVLESLETSLNGLRAEYRQLRNKKENDVIRVRTRIRQLEQNFESILAADMEQLSNSEQVINDIKALTEEAGDAVAMINESMEKLNKFTEIISKMDNIIVLAYQIVKKIS